MPVLTDREFWFWPGRGGVLVQVVVRRVAGDWCNPVGAGLGRGRARDRYGGTLGWGRARDRQDGVLGWGRARDGRDGAIVFVLVADRNAARGRRGLVLLLSPGRRLGQVNFRRGAVTGADVVPGRAWLGKLSVR
jgi:hypothetical protein